MKWLWLRLRAWREAKDDWRPCSTPWWEDKVVGCPRRTVPVGPRNTWSNAAYAAGGLVAGLSVPDPAGWVFCGAMAVLAAGSAAYHAVPGKLTNAWDHVGMYAAFLALTTYAVGAPWWLVLIGAGVGAVGWVWWWKAELNAMMGLFLILSATAGWTGGSEEMIGASLGLFGLAMVAWQLDRHRKWTGLWGHAAWHVLTAAAQTVMFLGVR